MIILFWYIRQITNLETLSFMKKTFTTLLCGVMLLPGL